MNKKSKENNPGKGNGKVYGNPIYSEKDDIYNRGKKELLDDEKISESKKEIPADKLSSGLDVPGAELDDANELIGEEDEENNYYSLGGENHDDPEEDEKP